LQNQDQQDSGDAHRCRGGDGLTLRQTFDEAQHLTEQVLGID
jgi:hypothetical protein